MLTIRDYISLVEQDDYSRRKAERTVTHNAQQGRKMVTCDACGGHGYYKNGPCGECGGSGKMREKPPRPAVDPNEVARTRREWLQGKPQRQQARRDR